jgi:hypothetical protein
MISVNKPLLLNVSYIKPDRKHDIEESFEIIYKDENDVVYKSNEPALAEIYFVKDEYRDFNYNKPQERIDKLRKESCLISNIRYKIAEEIGEDGLNFVKNCYNNRDYQALNRLYGWRYAFGCDFQPEFYFMKKWYEKYPLENVRLSKAFLDIETDIMDNIPDLEKIYLTAYSPVNLITIILEETKESFTFILKPYKPSKIGMSDEEYKTRYSYYEKQLHDHENLMLNLDSFIDNLHKSFDGTYGYLKYGLRVYEKEIDLIADTFRLLNSRKPNFCMIWNMRFDIQYLLERIKILGYDPKSIMCHPDFENPHCNFHVDKMTFKLEKQYDYF